MPLKKKKKQKKLIKKKALKRKVTKKKSIKRGTAVKKSGQAKKKAVTKKVAKKVIGVVTHYFPKVMAAVIKLKAPLTVGDTVKIKGHTTDFTQNVSSIQINHVVVNSAKKGQEIGLLVNSRVRQHDVVYKA